MLRNILKGLAAALLAVLVVYIAKDGLERMRLVSHLERVCEPGVHPDGPGPGYKYGVWTPLVPGLGRKDPKALKAEVCAAHGFTQP